MARIDTFTPKSIDRPSLHRSAVATFSILEVDGERCLQIDTYGSADRVMHGKVSQSLQLGEKGIAELRRILAQLG